MGFFTILINGLSGKTYKQNILLGNNTAELLKKHQELAGSAFTKDWIYSCILSCHVILDHLLFKGEPNFFNKNTDLLSQEKTFEIIKLLVAHHLSVFERNTSNIETIKQYGLNIKKLEEDIFYFFSFNTENKKIFKELDKDFDGDGSKYFLHLYKKILEKGYGNFDEFDIIGSIILSGVVSNSYIEIFIKTLKEKLNV